MSEETTARHVLFNTRTHSGGEVSAFANGQHQAEIQKASTRLLLPDDRVTPQQMSLDLSVGENFNAESTDFTHLWIGIVLSVCGPGGAHCPRRLQATVAHQSHADAHGLGSAKQRHKA